MSPTSSAPPVPNPANARIASATIAAWGVPIFALAALLFFVQFYFLKYATDVLLLPPAAVGVVFALGRLWDAITDPIVGTWSDRTRTRFGRRRPWMAAGVGLLAVGFVGVWWQPEGLGEWGRLVWATLALFAFYGAYTVYQIPHQSLGAELSTDHHDRSRVFGVQAVFFTVGMLLSFGAIQFVNNSENPREAVLRVCGVASVLVLVFLSIPPALLRERADYQGRGAPHPLRAMRDVLANPHARLLLFAQFVQLLGASVIGILSPFVFQYVLGRTDLIAILPAAFVLASMASVPLWVVVSRRVGKALAWRIGMLTFGISIGSFFFIPPDRIVLVVLMLVMAGVGSGCGAAVGPSMLADVIDWDELRSGERKEGAYSAAWGFAIKVSNAAVILLTGFGLEAFGFQANQEQTETAKLGLRVLFSALPFVMYAAGAWVLGHYALGAVEHALIRQTLDGRRGESRGP